MSSASSSCCQYSSLTVSVEGNIGSGKSTFLQFCDNRPNCTTYSEPVNKWQDLNGVNLLENFYTDRSRWAVPFQLYVGMTTLEIYMKPAWHNGLKLVERSLLSSQNVFLEHMRLNNVIEPGMCFVLDDWYRRTLSEQKARPNAIVYLRTTPESAYARVRLRNRGAETPVSLQYIREIHALHETWIAGIQANNGNCDDLALPILVINADRPLLQLYSEYEACLAYLHLLSL